jgi:hypothetical protein
MMRCYKRRRLSGQALQAAVIIDMTVRLLTAVLLQFHASRAFTSFTSSTETTAYLSHAPMTMAMMQTHLLAHTERGADLEQPAGAHCARRAVVHRP